MKLGSLFDGSGGFPLAGAINGMQPVWASEIEPYPLKVTEARFPNMKQLGDVTKIDGTVIDPVDVITFGSPCQDLSVAGKQAGIREGERSNLFFEAIRIIKEMREHDRRTGRAVEHLRPRFAVWENVLGAFSSNKGADFQAVLQALAEVVDSGVSIPLPEKGKWRKAGGIVGDGYSIAWRVYDAQFWGVPQRRKRIYLIADFGSERAGEILFEREGVCRDTAQSGDEGQGTAENAEGSFGRSGGTGCVKGFDAYQHHNWRESETLGTLTTAGASVRGDTPLVVSCDLYALEGNGSRDSHKGDGWKQTETMFTLNTVERHGVVYGIDPLSSNSMKSANPNSGFHEMNVAKCLDTSDGNPGKNQGGMCVVHDALNDMLPVVKENKPPRKYIVRRLTPLECCRLQGFPDWWEDGVEGSDSARYKMWGNGIALPCAVDVLGRVAKAAANES